MTERDARRTLGELNHTNPYTGESFGETQTFGRGRVVAADGGEAGGAVASEESETDDEESADGTETLKEIDHTPREDAPSANAAYDRDHPNGGSNDDAEEDVSE